MVKGTAQSWDATAHAIAAALGSHEVVPLIQPNASLDHAASGRQWTGTIYLATPQLLHAFGIPASQVDPNADVLTMRPGLSGLSKMQLTYFTTKRQRRAGPARAAGRPQGRPAVLPRARRAAAWPTR